MDEKETLTPSQIQASEKSATGSIALSALSRLFAVPKKQNARTSLPFSTIRVLVIIVLIVGILVLSIVSLIASSWLKSFLPSTMSSGNQAVTPTTVTIFKVQRTAPYAGLSMMIVNAQYATFFADDDIHAGSGVVRLNLQVTNHTSDQINVIYYEVARLLVPDTTPLSPTNVHLSVGPKPGKSETGWLDFSVTKSVRLDTLSLQLGSTTLNESFVTIPFSGAFEAKRYDDKTFPQSVTVSYNFFEHTLIYHLTKIEERFSYKGAQCKSGQKFYVLYFLVDNPEGSDISPGAAFDYARLVRLDDERSPIDSTLPANFKARSQRTSGYVVFAAPAGLKGFILGLLSQNGNGEQDTKVSW